MPDAAADRVRRLEAENASLRAKVAYLEEVLTGDHLSLPPEWRLTRSEARMFGCLVGSPFATKQMLMTALYFDRPDDDEPDIKIIAIHMCHLRRKLAPFGIAIEFGEIGRGYCLPDDARARFKPHKRIAA